MTDGSFVSPFPIQDPAALAVIEDAQADLARSIHGLLDACVRTRVDPDEMSAVTVEVRALTGRLAASAQDDPLGMVTGSDGRLHDWGNPMSGMRNPMAAPIVVTGDERGSMVSTFTMGAPYEGPPGCVHGGMIAAVLDQVVGSAPARIGMPALTAYLNTTYRRPTLLGVEHVSRGWIERVDGWKVFARGDIRDPQGRVTAEAEALFVVPRWAREHVTPSTWEPASGDDSTGDAPTP